jgi:hypothetical protein
MVNPYSFQFNPAGASAVATAAMSATATAAEGMVLSGGDGDGNDQEAGYEEETNNFTDEDGELPAATAADGTSATAPTLAGGGGSDSVTAAGAPASSSSADRSTAYSIRAILEVRECQSKKYCVLLGNRSSTRDRSHFLLLLVVHRDLYRARRTSRDKRQSTHRLLGTPPSAVGHGR